MSDEGTDVVKASPPQENWLKKNASGVLVGVLVTVIGGVILFAVTRYYWPSKPALEAVVRASPHYPLEQTPDAHVSVWDFTITNKSDKAATTVILQVPFKGRAKVKMPRQKEREVVVGDEGIKLGAMWEGDQATIMIWSPDAVDSVKTERIRIVGPEGAGSIVVKEPTDGMVSFGFFTTFYVVLSFVSLLLGWFLWNVVGIGREHEDLIRDLQREVERREEEATRREEEATQREELLAERSRERSLYKSAFVELLQEAEGFNEERLRGVLKRAFAKVDGEGAQDEEA